MSKRLPTFNKYHQKEPETDKKGAKLWRLLREFRNYENKPDKEFKQSYLFMGVDVMPSIRAAYIEFCELNSVKIPSDVHNSVRNTYRLFRDCTINPTKQNKQTENKSIKGQAYSKTESRKSLFMVDGKKLTKGEKVFL